MDIGPLEYVVIGYEGDHFTNEILPALGAIQASGLIRVVDLVFISKAADGTMTVREACELGEEDLPTYESVVEELMGWLTSEDIDRLAGTIPANTSAVIVLLEHTWTLGLADAVRRAGGVLFTGGIVPPEAHAQLGVELAAAEAKEVHHA